ncbi:hypothetical protein FIV42_16025 [Persicimonas caeni]|uniref:Uncharacterized protein n=1 Tax=Persicimonas caeni TaxID=2292766 RepID=A0A4Y6PVB8_PERCE|nr:hypothetical protein [Persicimonas caeni]QDG52193.1 hypothetical protein FIV42_16025 [Persicimonas caeni]QED33415.1 hypothetical protein FRD00_16020 [Persicimonas caeni]
MDAYEQILERWAYDYVPPDDLPRLLCKRAPQFDSAKQFGFFARVVIDEWQHGCPGLWSSWSAFAEIERLGVKVQTSRDPTAYSGPPTYHVRLVREVLEGAVAQLGGGEAGSERARDLVQAWGQIDILGRTLRAVAADFGVSSSTLHDRVTRARTAVYAQLVAEGLACGAASTRHRRKVLTYRASRGRKKSSRDRSNPHSFSA